MKKIGAMGIFRGKNFRNCISKLEKGLFFRVSTMWQINTFVCPFLSFPENSVQVYFAKLTCYNAIT